MKKSMKVATALAGAAVVVVGGSAFTANSMKLTDTTFVGTGSTTVTGVQISATDYTYDTGTTHLKKIDWTTKQNVADGQVTITSTLSGITAGQGDTGTCNALTANHVICTYSWQDEAVTKYPDMDAVTGISLTVLPKNQSGQNP